MSRVFLLFGNGGMKLKIKNISKKVLKQIKYVKGEGYKIIQKDGLSPETYYSRVGAAAMIMGVFDLLE